MLLTARMDLKKTLMMSVAFFGFIFLFLFWSQSSSTLTSSSSAAAFVSRYQRAFITNDNNNNKLKKLSNDEDLRGGSRGPSRKPSSTWTSWTCVNGRCVKSDETEASFNTLETCNMVCGTTPHLWPSPTGPMTIGTRYLRIDPSQFARYETNVDRKTRVAKLIDGAYRLFKTNTFKSVVDSNESETNINADNSISEAEYKADESTVAKVNSSVDVDRVTVRIVVKDAATIQLKLDTSEAYNLTITQQQRDKGTVADGGVHLSVRIEAETFFGARHALETLSQLIWTETSDGDDGAYVIMRTVCILNDRPRFSYRGILLDTARNFVPLTDIKRMLDGMSWNKLNVFHWHATDTQSFPLVLKSLPKLARDGAYGKSMTYTEEDVVDVVEYARVRGIRVIIEIDAPAHAGTGWTWGPEDGLGDLAVCVNAQPWNLYCGEPPCGQLNPRNPHVYDVLEKIYATVLKLTGERELFHIGGDEVNLDCWSQFLKQSYAASASNNSKTTASASPYTTGALLTNYMDLYDLWGNFTVEALRRLKRANGNVPVKKAIIWSSNLTKRPHVGKFIDPNDVIVQSWGASQWPDTNDLLADGYRVILSHVDAWYLDCGFGRWRETGDAACDPYRTWQQVYQHRPWHDALPVEEVSSATSSNGVPYVKQIVGGEACLWSEQLDAKSLDTRLWPRSAAFAERMWTDPPANSNDQYATGGTAFDAPFNALDSGVYTRLALHRRRMVARGLAAEALWPEWCTDNPGMCL